MQCSVSNPINGRLWFLVWFLSHQPHWELLFLVSDQRGALARFLARNPNSIFPSIFVLPLFLCQAMFHSNFSDSIDSDVVSTALVFEVLHFVFVLVQNIMFCT